MRGLRLRQRIGAAISQSSFYDRVPADRRRAPRHRRGRRGAGAVQRAAAARRRSGSPTPTGPGCSCRSSSRSPERRSVELPNLDPALAMAVNVSPTTIVSGRLHEVLTGVPVERVILELTEHAPVDDYPALRGGAGAVAGARPAPGGRRRRRRLLELLPHPRAVAGADQARRQPRPRAAHEPAPPGARARRDRLRRRDGRAGGGGGRRDRGRAGGAPAPRRPPRPGLPPRSARAARRAGGAVTPRSTCGRPVEPIDLRPARDAASAGPTRPRPESANAAITAAKRSICSPVPSSWSADEHLLHAGVGQLAVAADLLVDGADAPSAYRSPPGSITAGLGELGDRDLAGSRPSASQCSVQHRHLVGDHRRDRRRGCSRRRAGRPAAACAARRSRRR